MGADNRWVWMDCEMTGLEPAVNRLIEIAVIVTDTELNVLAEAPVWVIHQPESVLGLMDAWNQKTHGASGLIARVRAATLSEAQAEQQILAFLAQWVKPQSAPLCGNSIGQDRRFLKAHMPTLEGFFHYRNLDVSSLKILAQAWAPSIVASLNKPTSHEALADIRASIEELKVYRAKLLAPLAQAGQSVTP